MAFSGSYLEYGCKNDPAQDHYVHEDIKNRMEYDPNW